MTKQRIILLLVVCFSMLVLAAQPPDFKIPKIPPPKPGMSNEEYRKQVEDIHKQSRQEQEARNREYLTLMATEAWTHLLTVTEAQWTLIEPKYQKVNDLDWEMWVGASRWGGQESFRWYRSSERVGGTRARTLDEMTEGQKIAEELVDLLEDANSPDEQIRKKIDALQQARENARKALPKAKQELAAVLTTPRQEAVFLIRGYID
jgi:hypothetical protein